jgi:hypothetical protein
MSKFFRPITSPLGWQQLLADPDKHWRSGYSAKTLAYSWQESRGFPAEVQTVLRASGPFADIGMLLAIPEHQVPLPGGVRPSQSDIWVLARTGSALVSIAVEGKVDEPFGPTLDEWFAEGPRGKEVRLTYIREQLGLSEIPPGSVRYQLLHRTASAVIEAKRFYAAHAVLLVHSFSQSHDWFSDYAAFAKLFGAEVQVNRLVSVGECSGMPLHLCWVCGDARYLAS